MILAAMLAAMAPSCAGMTLEDAVADYARRVRSMDVAGMAALFGPDGKSIAGDRTLTGSKAIAGFLAGFADYKVTGETMTVDALTPAAGDWRTAGRFTQAGITPAGTPYSTHGRFGILWHCDPRAGWRVRQMETRGD